MTVWLALVFIGLGVLLRMAFERPNRFADVDELARRRPLGTYVGPKGPVVIDPDKLINPAPTVRARDEGRGWGMWSL